MAQCVACGKFLKSSAGHAVCPACKSASHYQCVNLPQGAKVASTWRCGACQCRTPKGRDPSMPVRTVQENYAVDEEPTAVEDTAEFSEAEQQLMRSIREDMLAEFSGMHDQLVTEINSFKTDFNIMFSEFREFRTEMAELRASISGMAQRMDGIERRLEAVERRHAEPAPAAGAEVCALERAVAELKQELNDRDQDALLADLEIGNLPEERGESVLHVVTVLAAKLGVDVEERDVVFAERVGAARGEGPEGAARQRARRVVVRFARRDLRDRLLHGARVRRTLTASDAGRDAAAAASRIYVNERLTRANRQLFYRVREECRRAQWRFSWTKRGRVYAREAEGKPAYPLRTEADFPRVFGSVPV